MKRAELRFEEGFEVVLQNRAAQAAVMVLAAGDSTGGSDNRHEGADQWLYVVEGRGTAIIEEQSHELRVGTLLLIERGEEHEIRSGDREPLRTLNIYVPPEY